MTVPGEALVTQSDEAGAPGKVSSWGGGGGRMGGGRVPTEKETRQVFRVNSEWRVHA